MKYLLIVSFFAFINPLISGHSVQEISADKFANVTSREEGSIMIMFYTPWCPHCQDTKPIFAKAAEKMAEVNRSNVFGLFNCDNKQNSEICTSENIEGYPTIKLYAPKGEVHTFMSEATEENLIKFSNDPSQVTESAPQEDEVADVPLKFTPYLTSDNFTTTLSKTQHALVFFYAPWCPHCHDVKPKVDGASEKLTTKSHVIFAINCEEKSSKKLCDDQKIDGFPTIRYFHLGEMFAEYDDNMEPSNFLKYLSKPPKEKIPLPTQQPESTNEDSIEEEKMINVNSVTKTDFEVLLKRSKGHVMSMFYVPMCSHCKEAKPIFDTTAGEVHKTKADVIFVAVNCEEKANEELCQKEKVQGFPTFIHYQNGKRVKEYRDHPITKEKLVSYFSTRAKEEL